MKTYNKKSNAKRAADSLAKKFTGFTAGDPVDAGDGEWFPNVIAPKSTIANGVPEELAEAACVNGAPYVEEANPEPATAPAVPYYEMAAKTTTTTETSAINARAGSKKEIVANMLLQPEGTTAKAILAATGWKALNIPGTAHSLGIKLRQVKEGRTTTYYGTR